MLSILRLVDAVASLGTLVYFRYIPTTVLDGVGEGPCVTGGAVWCILSDLLQGCELSAIPRCQEPGQVLLQPRPQPLMSLPGLWQPPL